MDRRTFVRGGVTAGVLGAALVAEGCATLGLRAPDALVPFAMGAFLADHDYATTAIARGDFYADLLRAAAPGRGVEPAAVAASQALARESFRTLLATGLTHDLPARERAHPWLQARLDGQLAGMDEAVLETAEALRALAPDGRS